MIPYYDDGLIAIYHADNAEVLPSIHDVDLVFMSPPYNLGASPWQPLGHWRPGKPSGGNTRWAKGADAGLGACYADHGDDMAWADYVAWQRDVLSLCWATLDDKGAIFYNHKPRVVGDELWQPTELLPTEVKLRQVIVWARAGGVNCNPASFMSTHEWIMVIAKSAWRLRNQSASGIGDVWQVAQEANPDHPAPFPIGLPARAIESTAPNLVLDPFAGSGTTLRAAKDAGVRAIGIEKSERYCEIAAKRLAQEALVFG